MKSKHQRVKQHLLRGQAISGKQAWEWFGLYRLSAVINRLRKDFEITTTWRGTGYAVYKMTPGQRKRNMEIVFKTKKARPGGLTFNE